MKKYFWKIEPRNLIFRSEILTYPINLKILKTIKEITENQKVIKILDAGCGTGKLARMISNLKNFQVYGIDKSEDAINLAKKQSNEIIYNVGDVSKLSDYYKKDSFDVIISTFTTLYLDRVKLNKFFKEASIVLNKHGKLIITDVHPFLPIIQPKTNWERWESKNVNYFKSQLVKQDIFLPQDNKGLSKKTLHVKWYHHPLFLYLNLLVQNGFSLNKFIEPRPSKNTLRYYPNMWGEEENIPVYFILCAHK